MHQPHALFLPSINEQGNIDTELRHPLFSPFYTQEPPYFCSLSLCLLFGEWNPFLSMTPRDLPTVPAQLRALLLWEQQAPLSPQLHQAVHTTDHPLTPDPSTLAWYAQSGTHTMGPVTAFTHLKNLRFILIRWKHSWKFVKRQILWGAASLFPWLNKELFYELNVTWSWSISLW